MGNKKLALPTQKFRRDTSGIIFKPQPRDRKNRDNQRRDRIPLFFPPEIGQISPHFGAIPFSNYAENWRKTKKKNTGKNSKKSSGDNTPKLQISVPCRGRTCPDQPPHTSAHNMNTHMAQSCRVCLVLKHFGSLFCPDVCSYFCRACARRGVTLAFLIIPYPFICANVYFCVLLVGCTRSGSYSAKGRVSALLSTLLSDFYKTLPSEKPSENLVFFFTEIPCRRLLSVMCSQVTHELQ